jgi:hypothetical protein
VFGWFDHEDIHNLDGGRIMVAVRRAVMCVLLTASLCAASAAQAKRGASTKAKAGTSAKAKQRIAAKAKQRRGTVEVSGDRQALIASTDPVTGHIVTFSAQFFANFRTTSGYPVSGLMITFRTAAGLVSSQPLCTGYTDRDGNAFCGASFTGNILQPIGGFVGGYDAIFAGDQDFKPATAHSTATPGP